jgi:hypothetical protein
LFEVDRAGLVVSEAVVERVGDVVETELVGAAAVGAVEERTVFPAVVFAAVTFAEPD